MYRDSEDDEKEEQKQQTVHHSTATVVVVTRPPAYLAKRHPNRWQPNHVSSEEELDGEGAYSDYDNDLDCNGKAANEIVNIMGRRKKARDVWTYSVDPNDASALIKHWANKTDDSQDTLVEGGEKQTAWVMNLYGRPPGPKRWLQIVQDARNVYDVLYRFPALDFGSAKGCGMSHMKAADWFMALLNHLLKNTSLPRSHPGLKRHPPVDIQKKEWEMLEDDCMFSSDKPRERWQQAKRDLPQDADLLLGGVHWADGKGTRILPHLVKLRDFSATQQCLFRASAYDKIKSFATSHETNIDRYMGSLARDGKLNVYVVVPFTSTQRAGQSHLRSGETNDAMLFANTERKLMQLPLASSSSASSSSFSSSTTNDAKTTDPAPPLPVSQPPPVPQRALSLAQTPAHQQQQKMHGRITKLSYGSRLLFCQKS